jgi:hypothetical protein
VPLLDTLGLKAPKNRLVGAGPRAQSTVTLLNRTGVDLKLLDSKLAFNTAQFVPSPPAVIDSGGRAVFKVVESTVGAARTAGTVRYHIDMRRHDVNVRFSWGGAKFAIKFEGDGPFSQGGEAVQDSEAGNTYTMFAVAVESPEDEKLQARIDILNNSGFDLQLSATEIEDERHTEFNEKPPALIPKKAFISFFAQALDDEQPDAAGAVHYVVNDPSGPPHTLKMHWRRGARGFAKVNPEDGAFVVAAKTAGDRFSYEVKRNDGPPPEPARPTKVTIVNNSGFVLTQDLLQLDSDKARFKSQPAASLDAGRKTQFEVEAPDPEFPNTSGIASYTLKLPSPDDPGTTVEHVVNMDWRSEPPPSFTKIVPAGDGLECTVSGAHPDITFTFTAPPLDFNPPAKGKEPTLRRGDKSPDGWVEYLQAALNHHINAGLEVDGDFGGETLKAVKAFQTKHKAEGVLVDGVVGDQTWSFLREGAPEKPKTDGRKPHTFVEKGLEARWLREKGLVRFDPAQDALVMQAVSVGDTDKVAGRAVRLRVTNPAGQRKVFERPLGPGVAASTTGQGHTHDVIVGQFTTLFDEAAKTPPPGDYTVEGFLDQELGGDSFSESVTIAPTP